MIPHGLKVKFFKRLFPSERGGNDSFLDRGIVFIELGIAIDGYHLLADT